jgi:hypothetical protein
MLPRVHGTHDGRSTLHELGPARPVSGLPRENQGCSKHGIGVLAREGSDGLLQTTQSVASIHESHATNERAVGEEGNVHGREGQQGVHDVGSGGTNPQQAIYTKVVSSTSSSHRVRQRHLRRDVAGPQGEVVGTHGGKSIVQGRDMVNEPQLLVRVVDRGQREVEVRGGEREDPSSLPLGDGRLVLRIPHQIGLVGSGGAVGICHLHVIVRATDLVLGAVSALGKVLVASDVSTLAGIASFAGLGMAPARRTAAWTSHCSGKEVNVRASDLKTTGSHVSLDQYEAKQGDVETYVKVYLHDELNRAGVGFGCGSERGL